MSKLSFRARALDATKPLPIYLAEELPDLPEYSAINRAVPQMPSGMEKEEECEHHLQRAIITGLIIPTPEVECMEDRIAYDRLYPANYKPPRQLIHMQPFSMEEDIPDYDIDSEDEKWLSRQKLDITPLKFEEMMDRLEKNCAQNFASQNHKELLLKDDDELSIAIFDYWLSKRLSTQPQPLVPCVKTEANNRGPGNMNNSNPYLAFRRRTEKMQTRKNRKNDETSYEKMVKLRRDLSRALQLLEMVKRRESAKKELLHLTVQLYEKRYQLNDFSGQMVADVSTPLKTSRPAFTPIYSNQYTANHSPWPLKPPKEDIGPGRKEKRQYKKRKHKVPTGIGVGPGNALSVSGSVTLTGNASSGEDEPSQGFGPASPPSSPQVSFPFYRNKNCSYHAAVSGGGLGSGSRNENEYIGSVSGENYRYSLASVSQPRKKCVGLVRRRIGRGGRVILDRAGPSVDDFWSSLDFKIQDSAKGSLSQPLYSSSSFQYRHYRPKTPPLPPPPKEFDIIESEENPGLSHGSTVSLQVENLLDHEAMAVELDLGELFPDLEVEVLKSELAGKRPKRLKNQRSVSPEYEGSSQFAVYEERWVATPSTRQSQHSDTTSIQNSLQTTSTLTFSSSSFSPLTTSFNHQRLPTLTTTTSVCERVPPLLPNGPLNHIEHGDRSDVETSSGCTVVHKWSSSSGGVGSTGGGATSNGAQINLLNSKLAGRAASNTSQLTNEGGSGHKRGGGTGGQATTTLVHSTPMEVT